MANEFWMSDRQWAVLEPLVPMNRRGVKPKRNREVINGIVHVLKVGCGNVTLDKSAEVHLPRPPTRGRFRGRPVNAPVWPLPQRRVLLADPDTDPETPTMQFRLTYAGKLMGSGGSKSQVDHKHEIRRAFHPQLREYWTRHPFLREWRGHREGGNITLDIPRPYP